MLQRLLDVLEAHQGEITQEELCRTLGVSPESLTNMLDILQRKGRIKLDESLTCGSLDICPSGKSCPGPEECDKVLLQPVRSFSFFNQK